MGPYDDDGYNLPPLNMHRHTVDVNLTDGRGDGMLFRVPDLSATGLHQEKRRTAEARAAAVAERIAAEPDEPWVVWVDTDYDADALCALLPGCIDVRGSMSPEEKARKLLGFTDHGGIMVTKPGIAGMGLNWQHCARVAFNGLSYSYERVYQAIRRCWRFGQTRPVDVHVFVGASELTLWSVIDRKADEHEGMKLEMFAASRRAVKRSHDRDPYNANHTAPIPAWLHTR